MVSNLRVQTGITVTTSAARDRSSQARWAVVAAGLGRAAAAVCVLAVFMHIIGRTNQGTDWWVDNLTLGVALGVPGVVLAIRLPRHPIGWILLAGGFGEALTGFAREYLLFAHDHGLPAKAWVGWFGMWAWMPGFGSMPIILLVFPDGRLPGRRWRIVAGVIAASLGLSLFGAMFEAGRLDPTMPRSENPLGWSSPLIAVASTIGTLLIMAGILLAVASVVVRYRRSSGDTRRQIRLVGFVGTLACIEGITELLPVYNAGPVLGFLATAALGAAIVVALLKYRLVDVDRFIGRTLVYAATVGGLVVLYVVTVVTLGTILQRLGATIIAAALIAVVFAPLREWAQRRVDRLLYGARRDPYAALSELGAQMDPGQHAEAGSVLDVAVAAVANAIRAPYAAIVLPGEHLPVATSGAATAAPVTIPLTFHGLDRGRLVVAPGARKLSPTDERLLADLARQTAAAVHAVLSSRDLQQSREALISTREEERRRLRRDLHDGLGPNLAAIGLRLEGTRQLIDRDPARACELIGGLKADVKTTLDDLRRLVYGLRPPSLDELGLVSAVREQASSFASGTGQDGLIVEVDTGESIGTLPAAVEVAAYRIVTEALTNVSRHARARHCRVRLHRHAGGALDVEIADDGQGLVDGWRRGVGTNSMAERAAELGGSCTVSVRPEGGTIVRAVLPVGGNR